MVVVDRVIPVGVVDCVAGPELLIDGELWFLVFFYVSGSISGSIGYSRLLFDGVGVVRYCCWDGNKYVVGDVEECSVVELEILRSAVERYLLEISG